MSGIPVHHSAPINPNAVKAADPAPQPTAAPNAPSSYLPAATPAVTTTSTAPATSTPAQPQAAAYPAPTSSLPASSTTYTPTPTFPPPPSTTDNSPPPPQPSALPTPFTTARQPNRPAVPPPPKANETPQPASYYAPQQTLPFTPIPLAPHQANPSLVHPARAQPHSGTTTTPQGHHDLSHPPGYMQNANASFQARPSSPYRPFDSPHTTSSNQSTGVGGLLGAAASSSGNFDGDGSGILSSETGKNIWNTAVSWAKTAGDTLAKSEQEVWKAINGEK